MRLAGSVVLLILIAFYSRPSYHFVYRQSHLYKIIYCMCLVTPLGEVKVGLLSENVLAGCTVTESKCPRIT